MKSLEEIKELAKAASGSDNWTRHPGELIFPTSENPAYEYIIAIDPGTILNLIGYIETIEDTYIDLKNNLETINDWVCPICRTVYPYEACDKTLHGLPYCCTVMTPLLSFKLQEAENRVRELEPQLRQWQSERQREHELRCKIQGDLESAKSHILELEAQLKSARFEQKQWECNADNEMLLRKRDKARIAEDFTVPVTHGQQSYLSKALDGELNSEELTLSVEFKPDKKIVNKILVNIDSYVPPGELVLRDHATGKVLGKIENIKTDKVKFPKHSDEITIDSSSDELKLTPCTIGPLWFQEITTEEQKGES